MYDNENEFSVVELMQNECFLITKYIIYIEIFFPYIFVEYLYVRTLNTTPSFLNNLTMNETKNERNIE